MKGRDEQKKISNKIQIVIRNRSGSTQLVDLVRVPCKEEFRSNGQVRVIELSGLAVHGV